jgi:transcriptional regulator with XRE-family HTH domain
MRKFSIQTNLTQLEIAKAMGVQQPQVSNWLTGKRLPTSSNLIRLADILQLYPEELLMQLEEAQKINQA